MCAALLCAWALPGGLKAPAPPRAGPAPASEEEVDAALRRAALDALGTREGTVVVMDAQTGRVRAVTNQRLAFEEAFPPGSTLKPFTLLAGLRSGALEADTRVLCRQRYQREDYEVRCSHPRQKPPFAPADALAHSCNYFFSRLGEHLDETAFRETLERFGFGAPTGAGGAAEASGALPRGHWRTAYALGEGGAELLVTPAQLVAAYAALVNGGHLFAPQPVPPQNFAARERARVTVTDAHRALVLKGMRGSVAYGTASPAELASVPAFVFGKTGTATPPDDFRSTHGWFVGFAADEGARASAEPETVRLAVLVFLKRARGSESAEVARPVFKEYARLRAAQRQAEAGGEALAGATEGGDEGPGGTRGTVRVRLAREDLTLRLALDEYVFGVVAAEASTEDEFEALKAQAVVSRTFAVRNAGRHAREGFDLCTSTHCQRYFHLRDAAARPDFYELVSRAVGETAGEVLRDPSGRVADSYFSAACGGRTADIRTLWGEARPPAHLRGVRDEACAAAPPVRWADTIPAKRLAAALGEDPRTDVGARLERVRVVERDASGRAARLLLEGERRRIVRGWDFKIVVGRALGWSVIKSTRFEVSRAGPDFVFHGTGFGHGLGLCQAGAHVLARRGASYRQILAEYLPGTSVGVAGVERADGVTVPSQLQVERRRSHTHRRGAEDAEGARRAESFKPVVFQPATFSSSFASFSPVAPSVGARLSLSSEHFRVSLPASRGARREAEAALRTLEGARADVARRLSAASLTAGLGREVELFVHETTGDFVGATGQPAWVAAVTRGRRIESQPLETLRRRGVLQTTLRHEYVHTVIAALSGGRAPRWLTEGLAAFVAGEGPSLSRVRIEGRMPLEEIERRLERPATASEMRALYAAAYREVSDLVRREGEPGVWRRVARV